jgi:hypothetical protein
MFPRINWRRMFVDLGWAMAMSDPMCYSYYLASRTQRTSPDRAPDIDDARLVFQKLSYENPAPLRALRPE